MKTKLLLFEIEKTQNRFTIKILNVFLSIKFFGRIYIHTSSLYGFTNTDSYLEINFLFLKMFFDKPSKDGLPF